MSETDAPRTPVGRRALAVLAVALLTTTALVRVPIEVLRSSTQDYPGAARDVLLTIFAGGLLAFLALTLIAASLPSWTKRHAPGVLVGLATFAWIRASFFPGPSVSLDGSPITADLSTGPAGLLVPLSGALLMIWAGARRPRVVTTFLAVLLGGSLVQSVAMAGSVWRTSPSPSESSAASALEWSRHGNVLIVILDSLQSDVFEDVLRGRPHLRERLDGFRYYRHATSSGASTFLSLPTIHSGRVYDPEESAQRFYHEAIYDGSVLTRLAEAGYRASYAMSLAPCPRGAVNCVGTAELARSRRDVALRHASRLLDLGVYRLLPDGLREVVLARQVGPFATLLGRGHLAAGATTEAAALEQMATASTVSDSPPTAKMIHTMITHRPAVLEADCSVGRRRDDRRGAWLQAACALDRIVALFERLDGEGAYDVSDIVVVADHGYGWESRFVTGSRDARFEKIVGVLNPVLLVKPAGSRGPLETSDAPVEIADLAPALCDEAGCSPADGLRRLGEGGAARTRLANWYAWKHRYANTSRIPGLARYSIRGELTDVESWSREAATYVPGSVIDFRKGRQTSGPYLGFGWGLRQRSHHPMADPRATLWLRLPSEPMRDHELVLEGRLSAASASSRMCVRVEVNDVVVGELTGTGLSTAVRGRRLRVPRSVLRQSPDITIRFSTDGPAASRDRPEIRLDLQTVVLRPSP